ncbi:hypothetical protein MMC28_007352 [Mycoblastus sanguinarius]|nr:hypothetical protein [Mycoblastus sanguinarius]
MKQNFEELEHEIITDQTHRPAPNVAPAAAIVGKWVTVFELETKRLSRKPRPKLNLSRCQTVTVPQWGWDFVLYKERSDESDSQPIYTILPYKGKLKKGKKFVARLPYYQFGKRAIVLYKEISDEADSQPIYTILPYKGKLKKDKLRDATLDLKQQKLVRRTVATGKTASEMEYDYQEWLTKRPSTQQERERVTLDNVCLINQQEVHEQSSTQETSAASPSSSRRVLGVEAED